MKRTILITALALVALAGCKQATAPIPAWAPNSALAVAGETIASANAAVMQYEADVKSGFVPAAALRTVMSDIQQALAIAQPGFNAWEAAARTTPTAPEPTSLSTAIVRISTDLSKLPSTAGN